jgi:hypothetical protein
MSPRSSALSFAACFFYLAFQLNHQFAYSRLVHWLDQTERFIEHTSLMLRPVRKSDNGS